MPQPDYNQFPENITEILTRYGRWGETAHESLYRLLAVHYPVNIPEIKPEIIAIEQIKSTAPFFQPMGTDGFGVSQQEFGRLILIVLYMNGGTMPCREIINIIDKEVRPFFRENDLRETENEGVKWKNRLYWAREQLCQREFLYRPNDSGTGTWELTPDGYKFAKEIIQHNHQ